MNVDEKIYDLVYLACASVDENGNVIKNTTNGTEPVMVGEKRLVLPNKYQLSGAEDPLWQTRCLFNPFLETVTSTAPTPVLDWLIRHAQLRLNVTITLLMTHILNIYASPAKHKELTPEQMEYISKVDDLDQKTLDFYTKSIAPLGQRGAFSFITLFPKNLGELNGITFKRTCHVSSPMYTELTTHRKFGKSTELAKGNSAKIAALLKLILPKIDQPEAYSKGSNSLLAPFAESFIGSMIKLTDHILVAQKVWPELFENVPREYGFYNPFELELFSNVDSLVDVIRKIPSVAGADRQVPATTPAELESRNRQLPPVEEPRQEVRSRYADTRAGRNYELRDRYSDENQAGTGGTTMSVDQILRNQKSSGHYDDDDGFYDDRRDSRYRDDYRDSYRNDRRREERYEAGSRFSNQSNYNGNYNDRNSPRVVSRNSRY